MMSFVDLNKSEDQVSVLTGFSKGERDTECKNNVNSNSCLSRDGDNNDKSDKMKQLASLETKNGTNRETFCFGSSLTIIICLIILIGTGASVAFLMIGMAGLHSQQAGEFERNAVDTSNRIINSIDGYIQAAAWIHSRCRKHAFTRQDFREMYEYLEASGLHFKSMDFIPKVTHAQREAVELESKQYYEKHHPHVAYRGIVGFNTPDATQIERRTSQEFYYPVHYTEPLVGNEAAVDLDIYSSEARMRAVQELLDTGLPIVSGRLSLVQNPGEPSRCGSHHNGPSFAVKLNHPGFKPSTIYPNEPWPHDISGIVICVPDLLIGSTEKQGKSSKVYIHDLVHSEEGDTGVFLGGAFVEKNVNGKETITLLDEISLEELQANAANRSHYLHYERTILVANRVWTVTVVANKEAYRSDTVIFIIASACIIFASSVAVAMWMLHSSRREAKFNELKAVAETEKAALILDNARKATEAERELNDFIAHEVRNPVAAALAACSFIKMTLVKDEPLTDAETRQVVLDDINAIDYSLNFVNDLLRNMLDMHRGGANQLHINKVLTDLLHDVLEPVSATIRQRGTSKVMTIVACEPRDLLVLTDSMRLKQVMTTLGRNSYKFVDRGFIRFSAGVHKDSGNVILYVEDSGSGIPEAKRNDLFTKYQVSLNLLSQGTGIGLFLCKTIVDLMGGEIYLDDTYDSGLPGQPGTRFVIDLKIRPIEPLAEYALQSVDNESLERGSFDEKVVKRSFSDNSLSVILSELPKNLSVLFVDDDPLLRKLFIRSIKGLCPAWTIRQAASGEAALQLIETDNINSFDLIFVDMYMASVEKQLLGTEAVAIMREKGVTSIICGLSANDKEDEFMAAGANSFQSKPIPCEHNALRALLITILESRTVESLP